MIYKKKIKKNTNKKNKYQNLYKIQIKSTSK